MTAETAGIGLVFRETMNGFLSLGEREPRAGERLGRVRRSTLRLRATIEIPDLAAFLRDPQHTGGLTASVDAPALGSLSSGAGLFRLFAPAPHPYPRGTRLMAYEIPLSLGDRPCYLAGEKLVVGGPLWRLWPETTTLFTRLHAGSFRSDDVLGAGVLRLGLGRFLALLLTLRASGTASAAQRAGTKLRFARFFAAQLAQSYGPRLPATRRRNA